jgi:hypothetical protein
MSTYRVDSNCIQNSNYAKDSNVIQQRTQIAWIINLVLIREVAELMIAMKRRTEQATGQLGAGGEKTNDGRASRSENMRLMRIEHVNSKNPMLKLLLMSM